MPRSKEKSFLTRFSKVCPDSEQTRLAQAQACVKGKDFSAHLSLFSDVDIPGSLASTILIERFPWARPCELSP